MAVPRGSSRGWQTFRANIGLCRRLGLGVLSVGVDGRVEVHAEPGPYEARRSKVRRVRLVREFERRSGDPNLGGSRGKVVTAYRQDALRCAAYLGEHGASKGAVVARATSVAKATRLMRDNHYGWFIRVSPGVYGLAPDVVLDEG